MQPLVWLLAVSGIIGAAKLLLSRSWLAGWLRGSCGLLLFAAALLCVALALELRTYYPWPGPKTIASISFQQLEEQHFLVRLTRPHEAEQFFELYGDQWQLDASLLNWNRALQGMGLKPVYRFERLGARYLTLEQELASPPRSYALTDNLAGAGVSRIVRAAQGLLPWFSPEMGGLAFMPMTDGAEYILKLNEFGLTAEAQNAAARQALAGR